MTRLQLAALAPFLLAGLLGGCASSAAPEGEAPPPGGGAAAGSAAGAVAESADPGAAPVAPTTVEAPLPEGESSRSPAVPGSAGPLAAGSALGSGWQRASTLVVWPSRDGHATVVHRGKLWVLGGWGSGPLDDVWVSDDGDGWRAAPAAPWPPRRGHAAVVFRDRIWILGGSLGAESAADVWSSEDGLTWERGLEAAPWGPRNEHAAVVFDGKLWLLGGWSGGDRNDVWSSPDGVTWTRVTEGAPWSPRNGHAVAVYDGRLWVLGGWGPRSAVGEDGAEGRAEPPAAPAGDGRSAAAKDGDLSDVWSSPDGVTWERVTAAAPWSARNGHTALSAAGRLWVLGGWADGPGGTEGNVNDVWWSEDGRTWRLATGGAPWLPRNGHTSALFRGRLWVIGGWSHFIGGTGVNDLWSTEVATGEPEPEGAGAK